MKADNTVDCMRMKRDIQARLQRHEETLSWQQRNQCAEERVMGDPVLGPWFRTVVRRKHAVPMLCEGKGEYKSQRRKKTTSSGG